MKRGWTSLCLATLLAIGCSTERQQALDRCHASLNLHSLAERVGVPPRAEPWGWLGSEENSRGRHFDIQQRATLALDSPREFTRAICDVLRGELAGRCEVREAWAGADYCAFVTESRRALDAQGRYLRRPAQGRVAVFAAPAAEVGRTELVLAATEWED